jgi:hypothetical protein
VSSYVCIPHSNQVPVVNFYEASDNHTKFNKGHSLKGFSRAQPHLEHHKGKDERDKGILRFDVLDWNQNIDARDCNALNQERRKQNTR